MEWWSIDCQCGVDSINSATAVGWVMTLGVEGTTELSDDSFRAYFCGSQHEIKDLCHQLHELGITTTTPCLIPDQNWVASASELLQPLSIGAITVKPLISATEATPAHRDLIQIVTGTGFGTGHHATTATCLELLQNDLVKKASPRAVLDFGTGSGILTIAMAKLYGSSVVAIDNDPLALVNAKENIIINGVSDLIELGEKYPLRSFDFIIANVYAEVLIAYHDFFLNSLQNQGGLLLSGIMESKVSLIRSSFTDRYWTETTFRSRDGWITVLFQFNGKQ
jgi:ribosomal protein L11 methyltransferase